MFVRYRLIDEAGESVATVECRAEIEAQPNNGNVYDYEQIGDVMNRVMDGLRRDAETAASEGLYAPWAPELPTEGGLYWIARPGHADGAGIVRVSFSSGVGFVGYFGMESEVELADYEDSGYFWKRARPI